MSFAAPVFAWVAAGVALATVALHLLAWRRPPASPLPTARFVPETPVRTVSRDIRPADLALLALRVVLLLLIGGALAGPTFASRSGGIGRVVVVDRSRVGVSSVAVSDTARAAFRAGDALVVFDSAAREVVNPAGDSIGMAGTTGTSGSLSAALIVAIRAAKRLERERDSVEIVLVSPFASDELDAATASIRRMWPGPIRTMRAGPVPNAPGHAARPDVRATPGDAVGAALALAGDMPGGGDVRVVRDAITPSDTAWARGGHTVVAWPASITPEGWPRRASSDTSFAVSVLAGGPASVESGPRSVTVVAPFVRAAQPPPGQIVARWQDGEPAVTEIS